MSEAQPTVTVKGIGTVAAQFTSVAYKATAIGRGKTSAKAKAAIHAPKTALISLINEESGRAGIDPNRIKTALSLEEYGKYDDSRRNLIVEGYIATFTVSFTGKNLNATANLHDCLTSIEGVTSPSPQFLVESDDALQDAAFKAAHANAKRLFEAECTALGLSPVNYEIVTWQTRDPERPQGKTFSLSAEQSSMEKLRPGQADYKLEIYLTYAKKNAR